MSEFVNRTGSNLNKRVLEVEKVERDQAGEISKIYVKVSRNDSPTTVGTPLSAESLKTIISEMIDEAVKKNNDLDEGSGNNGSGGNDGDDSNGGEEEITTDFNPKTFSKSWTQQTGSLNSSNLIITSTNQTTLYVEVENEDSASIDVSINTNNSSSIRINITEKSGLNSMGGYTTPQFTFYVHVYLDSSKITKLGTLTGTITYHFSSVTPDD